MKIAFVYTKTDQPIYIYDTTSKVPKFFDIALEKMMRDSGVRAVLDVGGQLQEKTAKLTEPDFHKIFLAYSKIEYDQSKFHWKVLQM